MAPLPPIKNARDFLGRYGLDNRDPSFDRKPLLLEKNEYENLRQLSDDYHSLPADDQYAAFARLHQGNHRKVLRYITGYRPKMLITERLGPEFDNFFTDRQGNSAGEDVWIERLKLREMLFFLEEDFSAHHHLASLAGSGILTDMIDASDLVEARDAIKNRLVEFYKYRGPRPGNQSYSNPYWDSDDDFDPLDNREDWDFAFDDKDILPLDSNCKYDRDNDLVCDKYDSDSDNKAFWRNIAVGESIESNYYTVKRLDKNSFEISKTLAVGADPKGDRDKIRSRYLNEGALRKLQRQVERVFASGVQRGKYRFTLSINFKIAQPGQRRDINFTDREIRADKISWDFEALNDPRVVLHELFHHFGFHDYYHESLIGSGIRDFSLRPGYEVLGTNLPTGDPDYRLIMPQAYLLNMVAQASFEKALSQKIDRQDYDSWAASLAAKPLYELDYGVILSRGGLQCFHEQAYEKCIEPALKACKTLFRDHKDDPDMLLGLNRFQHKKYYDPKLETSKYYYDNYDSAAEGAYILADNLRLLEKFDEAERVLRQALEKDPEYKDNRDLLVYILRKTGRHSEANIIESMAAIRIDPLNIEACLTYSLELFDQGRSDQGIVILSKLAEAVFYLKTHNLLEKSWEDTLEWVVQRIVDKGVWPAALSAITCAAPNITSGEARRQFFDYLARHLHGLPAPK